MDKQKYTTTVISGKNQSPVINYERQHHIDCVTKFLVDYLLEDKMTIKIFGNQELKRKKPVPRQSSQQINSRSNKPMYGNANNRSGDQSGLPGVNSTMNSSMNSQNSGSGYKIQGQTVASISNKQMIQPAGATNQDLMGVDPLRGMHGSYKNQDPKNKKNLVGRMFGKK